MQISAPRPCPAGTMQRAGWPALLCSALLCSALPATAVVQERIKTARCPTNRNHDRPAQSPLAPGKGLQAGWASLQSRPVSWELVHASASHQNQRDQASSAEIRPQPAGWPGRCRLRLRLRLHVHANIGRNRLPRLICLLRHFNRGVFQVETKNFVRCVGRERGREVRWVHTQGSA